MIEITQAVLWPGLPLGLALCGAPLFVAWIFDRCFSSRAAVRSLRLRAALVASALVALAPLLPLRVPRPSWLATPRIAKPQMVPVAPQVLAPSASLAPQELQSPRIEAPRESPKYLERANEAPPSTWEQPAPRSTSKYLAPRALNWRAVVLLVWASGAMMLLAWSAWCHILVARLRGRSQVLASGAVREEALKIASEWKMKLPRLLEHGSDRSGACSPFASGVWRASIVWAREVEAERGEWRAILRHEMAHCRRGDCAWNACAQVLRALLWPQPMLWWACAALRKNAEDVCDEAALEGCAPTAYARGLLDLSRRLQIAPSTSTCRSAARGAQAGALPPQPELSRRVTRILKLRASDAWRIERRTRISTFGAGCAVVGATILATSTEAPRAQEMPEAGAASAPGTSGAARKAVGVDLSSPQATLDTFVAAVRAGDARALAASVETANSSADLEDFAATIRSAMLTQVSLRVSPWSIASGNGAALARANVIIAHQRMGNKQTAEATLRLRKSAQGWRIRKDDALANSNADPFAWIVSVVANPEVKRLREWAAKHGRGVLQGQVLLADGSPASGATVVLEMGQASLRQIFSGKYYNNAYNRSTSQRMSRIVSRRVTTDARGMYRIDGLTDASYAVSALWPATTSTEKNRDFDAQQIAFWRVARAREGALSQAPILKAQPTARVEVLVVDARDGAPLQGAYFSAVPKRSPSMSRVSGADGRAILNLPPGEVGLYGGSEDISEGRRRAWAVVTPRGNYSRDRAATVQAEGNTPIAWGGGTTINVASGQARRLTVRLMPYSALPTPRPTPQFRAPTSAIERGDLTGRVQYEGGRPAANVIVTARMQSRQRWEITNREGLSYTHADREPQMSRWRRVRGIFHVSARTDAGGNFRLRGLTTAPYDLMTGNVPAGRWLDPGTVGSTLSLAATGVWARGGRATRVPEPLVLIEGALVRGRVTDKKSGAGIGGVAIVCVGPHRPQSSGSEAGVESEADGSFVLRVSPGSNEIDLSGPSDSNRGRFRIADNGQSAGDYVLTLPRNVFYEIQRYTSQLDGRVAPTKIVLPNSTKVILNTKRNETHTLNFQLRRLRRATPEEEAGR